MTQRIINTLSSFITRWMAVIVLLAAICAYFFPDVMGVVKTSWVTPLLGCVMFGMGLTLDLGDFGRVFSRPKDVIAGILCQFIIMPLLALALVKLFHLPAELAVGVILVGCCPGGTSSNVITFLSKGDVALSVGMTGISTLLAPVMLARSGVEKYIDFSFEKGVAAFFTENPSLKNKYDIVYYLWV